MKRITMRPLVTAAFAAALSVGCSSLADPSSKPGELGNGGFYFSCSDAVACSKYSGDASKFPSAVSLGSTFSVRFVPKPSNGLDIHFNDSAADRGITVQAVGEQYISRGPSGLAAVKPGFATLTSRDAQGQLVDYVVIKIAKPDALVVYAADTSSTTPAPVDKVELTRGDRRAFRAFAQEKKSDLAGTLQVEWTSSSSSIVAIESTTDGKATLVARAAGTATLTATGGTFAQNVVVEVKP
jgi:hypothetical protein